MIGREVEFGQSSNPLLPKELFPLNRFLFQTQGGTKVP